MNSEKPDPNLPSKDFARKSSRGFSLVEVLIVLALIGMLAGLAVANIDKIFGGAKKKTARAFVTSSMETAMQTYMLDIGKYPTSLKDLKTNPGAGSRWNGPYVKESTKFTDPWGNEYQYRTPGQKSQGSYDVWSNGPDGQPGTADDIGNWDE